LLLEVGQEFEEKFKKLEFEEKSQSDSLIGK
jgi:hypothetical protein